MEFLQSKPVYYDPPSGWQYGFPKEYKPRPGEVLNDTLLRDGYPQSLIDVFKGTPPVRFWGDDTQADVKPGNV